MPIVFMAVIAAVIAVILMYENMRERAKQEN